MVCLSERLEGDLLVEAARVEETGIDEVVGLGSYVPKMPIELSECEGMWIDQSVLRRRRVERSAHKKSGAVSSRSWQARWTLKLFLPRFTLGHLLENAQPIIDQALTRHISKHFIVVS